MSMRIGRHEPTPEFKADLERRLVERLREDAVVPSVYNPILRRLRTAAMIIVALGVGAFGAVAAAQVQDSRTRDQLLAAAGAEVQVATMRLELARAHFDDVRARFAVGAVGRETLTAAESELHVMEAALNRASLDVLEIQATSAPPRDDLAAPLVRGRDFVRERLLMDLAAAQHRLRAIQRNANDAQEQHRLGVLARLPLLEAQAELARARSEFDLLAASVQLRQEFLEQHLAVDDVARRQQRTELTLLMQRTSQLHELARQRLEILRQRRALGQEEQAEVLRAELRVLESALELSRMQRELEQLGRSGSGREPPDRDDRRQGE